MHWEAFCKPSFTGIVAKGEVKKKTMATLFYFSQKYDLPVYKLAKRRLTRLTSD